MPEPQGHVSGQTSTVSDQRVAPSQGRDILIFAALGVVSGTLSFIAGKHSQLPFLHLSFFPYDAYRGSAPILPGVIFGLLVAGCAHHFGSRDRLRLLLAVLLTTAAWVLAFDLTSQADFYLGMQVTSDARGAITCGIGGFVGGLGTCIAVAIANPKFRRLEAWLLTVLVATLFGAIEKVYEQFAELFDDAALYALFVAWQAAVIAAVARGLGRARAS
jgi:hypothetical protein